MSEPKPRPAFELLVDWACERGIIRPKEKEDGKDVKRA